MAFLNELNINELSTSGVIALIVAVFTVVGFIRGAVKLVFLLFALAGAGYAAYWGSEVGFIHIQEQVPDTPALLGDVLGLISGVVVFYLLSKIFGFFADPFETSSLISNIAFGIPAAIISLVAAAGLVWGSLVFLKDKGAESEIRYWLAQDDSEGEAKLAKYPTIASLKQRFEESFLGEKVMSFYQINESEKYHLAKLLVMEHTSPSKMSELADNIAVRDIFENPKMTELREDPTILKLIEEDNSQGLLRALDRARVLEDERLLVDLSKVSAKDLK